MISANGGGSKLGWFALSVGRSRSVMFSDTVWLLRLLLEPLFLVLLLGMVAPMPQRRMVGTSSCSQGACGPTIDGPAAVTEAVGNASTALTKSVKDKGRNT